MLLIHLEQMLWAHWTIMRSDAEVYGLLAGSFCPHDQIARKRFENGSKNCSEQPVDNFSGKKIGRTFGNFSLSRDSAHFSEFQSFKHFSCENEAFFPNSERSSALAWAWVSLKPRSHSSLKGAYNIFRLRSKFGASERWIMISSRPF